MVVLAAVTGSLLYRRLAHVATVALVFTFAARTHPSRLAITSTTLPSGHFPLEKVSSATSTKSPICKFLFGSVHFFLSNRVGRYSLVHLRQNKLARYCACLQARLQLRSSLSKTPGGTLGYERRCNKWLGVNGCSSKGLSLFLVRGLEYENIRHLCQNGWEDLIGDYLLLQHRSQDLAHRTYHPLPDAAHVARRWWIENPFYHLLSTKTVNLLIPSPYGFL